MRPTWNNLLRGNIPIHTINYQRKSICITRILKVFSQDEGEEVFSSVERQYRLTDGYP